MFPAPIRALWRWRIVEADMHETRNFLMTLVLIISICWAIFVWLVAPEFFKNLSVAPWQKVVSLLFIAISGAFLIYAYRYEDKMEDNLARVTAGRYYEFDGLCFMPLIRVVDGRAEISLYYQNRFSNPCEAVIHLRPPRGTFASHAGATDVHFAFRVRPGAFGVIHQPIAVAKKAQGEVIEAHLAAAVRWPMSHGDELRSHAGMRCGTFDVDWALAYRQSEHELCGEIDLKNPAVVHLAMPKDVSVLFPERAEITQETIVVMPT